MFAAALGSAAPFALAGKAVGAIASHALTSQHRQMSFQDAVETLSSGLNSHHGAQEATQSRGSGPLASGPETHMASTPLPPAPAPGQPPATPMPAHIENVHRVYAQLGGMRP